LRKHQSQSRSRLRRDIALRLSWAPVGLPGGCRDRRADARSQNRPASGTFLPCAAGMLPGLTANRLRPQGLPPGDRRAEPGRVPMPRARPAPTPGRGYGFSCSTPALVARQAPGLSVSYVGPCGLGYRCGRLCRAHGFHLPCLRLLPSRAFSPSFRTYVSLSPHGPPSVFFLCRVVFLPLWTCCPFCSVLSLFQSLRSYPLAFFS